MHSGGEPPSPTFAKRRPSHPRDLQLPLIWHILSTFLQDPPPLPANLSAPSPPPLAHRGLSTPVYEQMNVGTYDL